MCSSDLQGAAPPELTLPAGRVDTESAVTFVETEQTWLALHVLPAGFVLEVGESATHGNFVDFRQQVLARSRLTVMDDRVEYQGSQGKTLALQPQADELPQVWRDGQRHDWANHTDTADLFHALEDMPPE